MKFLHFFHRVQPDSKAGKDASRIPVPCNDWRKQKIAWKAPRITIIPPATAQDEQRIIMVHKEVL